jgi:VWFA-related protein
MKRARRILGVFLCLACAASAQQPSPAELPRATGAVELSILNVDVIVTGKDGRPVRGLAASDFQVRLDGKPAKVTNFLEVGPSQEEAAPVPRAETAAPAEAASVPPGVPETPSRPPRHVVIFIDHLRLPERDKREATFGAIKSLLARVLGPGDDAMIVTWDRSVRGVLPFTGDRAVLDRALDAEAGRSLLPGPEATNYEQILEMRQWFVSNSLPADSVGPDIRALAAEALAEMRAKGRALKALIATLGGLDGKKILVFASHRFSRYPGAEYFMGSRDGIGSPPSSDSREFDARDVVDGVADAANANGVTLYPIYPAGWDTNTVSAAESLAARPGLSSGAPGSRQQAVVANEEAALETVANRTGGLKAIGPAPIAELVPRVVEDLESYYSLGVPSPAGKSGRELKVAVTVSGHDVSVRTRRSLVDKTIEKRMEDRVLANLFRRDTISKMRLTAITKPAVEKRKGLYRIPFEVSVPIGSLALLPGARGSSGSFSVFVASASPTGAFTEVTRETRRFEIAPKDLERAKTSHFAYTFEIETRSLENRVSVGVLDDVGKTSGFLLAELHDVKVAPAR